MGNKLRNIAHFAKLSDLGGKTVDFAKMLGLTGTGLPALIFDIFILRL